MSGLNNNRIGPHGRTTKEYWNPIPLDGSNLLGLGFWGGIFVFSPGVIKSKETARSSDWPVYVFIQPLDGNFAIGGPGPQSIPEIPDMWCIFKVRVHHSLKTHTHTCSGRTSHTFHIQCEYICILQRRLLVTNGKIHIKLIILTEKSQAKALTQCAQCSVKS